MNLRAAAILVVVMVLAGCDRCSSKDERSSDDMRPPHTPSTSKAQNPPADRVDRIELLSGPLIPREHSMTLLRDGRVLITGGAARDKPGYRAQPAVNQAWLFNPADKSWTKAAPMRSPRRRHTATLLEDGRVLVAGGYHSEFRGGGPNDWADTIYDTTELWDPATDSWTAGPTLIGKRALHAALRLPDGRVLIAGGMLEEASTAELIAKDASSTERTGDLSISRISPSLVTLANGAVFVAGGHPAESQVLEWPFEIAEVWSPEDGRWRRLTPMDARSHYAIATGLRDGRPLVIGPERSLVWSPATQTWSRTQAPLAPRDNQARPFVPPAGAAVTLRDGRVLRIGGTGKDRALTTTELLDSETLKWSAGPALRSAHRGGTATLLGDGSVLILSGFEDGNPVPNELFVPGAGAVVGLDPAPVASNAVAVRPPHASRWTSVGSLRHLRWGHRAVALDDGRVLIVGGMREARWGAEVPPPLPSELIDAVGVVEELPPLTRSLSGHTAVRLGDGRVMIAGGSASGRGTQGVTNAVTFFLPREKRFERGPPMLTARTEHTATVLLDGSVLVVGGSSTATPPLASAELWTPKTNAWVAVGPMKRGRSGHHAVRLPDGGVLVVGFVRETDASSSPSERWDPVTRTFSDVGREPGQYGFLPYALAAHDGGYAFAASGEGAIIWEAGAGWTRIPEPAFPPSSGVAHALAEGRLLLIASRAGTLMGPTPVVQSYDLRAARWTDEPNLLFGREGFASCVTDDGRVYVTGGVGGGWRTLDSVEVFRP